MLPRMTADPAQGGTVVAGRPSCVSSLLTGPRPPPVVLGDFARDGSFASAVGGAKFWEQIQQGKQCKALLSGVVSMQTFSDAWCFVARLTMVLDMIGAYALDIT